MFGSREGRIGTPTVCLKICWWHLERLHPDRASSRCICDDDTLVPQKKLSKKRSPMQKPNKMACNPLRASEFPNIPNNHLGFKKMHCIKQNMETWLTSSVEAVVLPMIFQPWARPTWWNVISRMDALSCPQRPKVEQTHLLPTRSQEKPRNLEMGHKMFVVLSLEFQESLLPWWGSKQNQTNKYTYTLERDLYRRFFSECCYGLIVSVRVDSTQSICGQPLTVMLPDSPALIPS